MIPWSIRIAVGLVLASAAFNAGAIWHHRTTEPATDAAHSQPAPDPSSLATADTLKSPRRVVDTQMAALAECRQSERALHQVYALASPANKEVTGPIDRFAAMLLSPTFRPLVDQQRAIVGDATIRGDLASVMVTIVDEQRQPAIFHFYLERGAEPSQPNSWTVYGVTRDRGADQPSEVSQPMFGFGA